MTHIRVGEAAPRFGTRSGISSKRVPYRSRGLRAFPKQVKDVGLVPILLVGYDYQRHLYGLSKLSQRGIDRVYVLYDCKNEEFGRVAEENARKIREAASNYFFLEASPIGYNPQDYIDAIKTYTKILSKEKEESQLTFDVTNTTKESLLASFHFGSIFGSGLYYVEATKHTSLNKRVSDVFDELKSDERLLEEFSQRNEIGFKKFMDHLKTRYLDTVILQYENREPGEIRELLPSLPRAEIEARHNQIIISLHEPANTIAELTDRVTKSSKDHELAGKTESQAQASVNYYLSQLEKWGFVKAERGRRTTIVLTEFGEGYRRGISGQVPDPVKLDAVSAPPA